MAWKSKGSVATLGPAGTVVRSFPSEALVPEDKIADSYFNAFNRVLSRDLYRDAVFS